MNNKSQKEQKTTFFPLIFIEKGTPFTKNAGKKGVFWLTSLDLN